MASVTTDTFLDALTRCGLLTPAQAGELTHWVKATGPDPGGLAKEVSRRGWLTPYQLREIYKGRGPGLTLGPYVLLDRIGEGGMGQVYRARHTRLGRDVALKLIRKEKLANPQTVRRFRQEVQAAAHLSHPNVVLAFDADEINGQHLFAMEYVEGKDLTKVVRERGPLPIPEACEYIRQAALGLQHAYERGLVHRDVKPSNLLAMKNGQVKVLDLGLALLNVPGDDPDAGRVTVEGFVLGTPDFVAPEQARNPLAVDTRADVYALGATLFYLLTAKVPYDGPTPTEKLLQHVMEPPPDLRKHRPDVPRELADLVKWLMAKGPEDRPQTPIQAAVALQPFCPLPPGAAPPPPAAPPAEPFRLSAAKVVDRPPMPKQSRSLVPGLAVVGGLLAVLAGGVLLLRPNTAPAPPAGPPEPVYANPFGMKLVLLPGGTFVRGSPAEEPGRGTDEGPAGEVTVGGPFYMAATETTNAQFMDLTGKAPAWAMGRAGAAGDLPVESVTWDDARDFCKRLNDRDTRRRAGWAYRLPTEAEWEYACRAGSTAAFTFGDKIIPGQQAVFRPSPGDPLAADVPPKPPSLPRAVGQTEANRFGLYDLHGNVWEWCQDRYARGYPAGPRTDPTGPPDGDRRVARGGGWDGPGVQCRSAARRGLPPDTKDAAVGFRVVLAPAGP